MVRVAGVVAGLEHDALAGRETGQRVDMGVRVVAFEITVVEPQHAVGVQALAQDRAHFLARLLGMALHQAAPGGEDASRAVALDAAAFQRPVDALVDGMAEHAGVDQAGDQGVVLFGAELAAPTGEAEISELKISSRIGGVATLQRDRAGVAQPRVVVGQFDEADLRGVHAGAAQLRLRALAQRRVRDHDDQRLEPRDRGGQCHVGGFHRGQPLGPVRAGMRPGDQYRGLRFPFRRQAQGGVGHGGVLVQAGRLV